MGMYFLFKCSFLGWCMAPFPWNGANFIHGRVLKPFVTEHKEKIDEYLEQAKERANCMMKLKKKRKKQPSDVRLAVPLKTKKKNKIQFAMQMTFLVHFPFRVH